MSLMVYLLGMPASLHYERSHAGSGMATFTFASGAVASLAMTHGQATNGGMERTVLVGSAGGHIVVDNNVRVSFHRSPPLAYGASPSFYEGTFPDATSVWEPEFSLGQLYNKGLFLLGYYDEVNEFARCVLSGEPPTRGTLDQAIQVTRVFEAFAEGPGKTIPLTRSEGTIL
jgi:predicted dehydrogenase